MVSGTTQLIRGERETLFFYALLGRTLFEESIQNQIESYEKGLTGCQQKWERWYHSRLGDIRLIRRVYSGGVEVDKVLKLPENGWLSSVEKLATLLGIEMNFERAAQTLHELTGVEVTGLGTHVEEIGRDLSQESHQKPLKKLAPLESSLTKALCFIKPKRPFVYLGMDGIMVPLNQGQGCKEAKVGVLGNPVICLSVRNEMRCPNVIMSLPLPLVTIFVRVS